jgi:hypothetical protein
MSLMYHSNSSVCQNKLSRHNTALCHKSTTFQLNTMLRRSPPELLVEKAQYVPFLFLHPLFSTTSPGRFRSGYGMVTSDATVDPVRDKCAS